MSDLAVLDTFFKTIGFRGTFRPAEYNIVTPIVRLPLTLTNTGAAVTLNGTAPSPGQPQTWPGDPNLGAFMPSTGRFYMIWDRYQFVVTNSSTLTPAEQASIAQIIQGITGNVGTQAPGLRLVHTPPGKRAYAYQAAPGAVWDVGAIALGSDAAGAARLGVQTPYLGGTGIQDIGEPVALDFANDSIQVQYPVVGAAPATFSAFLELHGFAIQYDQYPEITKIVKEAGPTELLQVKAIRRALPSLLAERLLRKR